jgi:hypothetical protein
MIKDIVLLIERCVVKDRVKRCNIEYKRMFYVVDDYPVYVIKDIGFNNRKWFSETNHWTWSRIYNIIIRRHKGYLPKNY